METTGTLEDVLASVNWALSVAAPLLLVIVGAVGGVGLAGTAGFHLWQHVQDGGPGRSQGTALGWVMGIVAGALLTMFSVFIGLFSFLFTGWG